VLPGSCEGGIGYFCGKSKVGPRVSCGRHCPSGPAEDSGVRYRVGKMEKVVKRRAGGGLLGEERFTVAWWAWHSGTWGYRVGAVREV
jgi:hypothetical protein